MCVHVSMHVYCFTLLHACMSNAFCNSLSLFLYYLLDRVPVDPLVDSLVTCLKLTSLALDDVSLSLKNLLAVVKSLHNLRVIRLKEVSLSDEGVSD